MKKQQTKTYHIEKRGNAPEPANRIIMQPETKSELTVIQSAKRMKRNLHRQHWRLTVQIAEYYYQQHTIDSVSNRI